MTYVTPKVSIVTTVYERVHCLRRCLASVKKLTQPRVEHLVVSDHPPTEIVEEIEQLCAVNGVRYFDLPERKNDWGISPATAGLHASLGEYVCFLSDDNAYLPDHFEPLVALLDAEPTLGFAYSSALYAGARELRFSPPIGAGIDLGQPLFRRSMLLAQFPDALPHAGVFSWDWELIRTLVYERGVSWRHVDRTTFVFRLAAYPHLVEALA